MNKINHIAFIMDGNGRWGKKKGKSRNFGHLNGIKVIDFTRVLAGPHFTKMLSDMGAEVIKIEHPETGDLARLGTPISGNFSHYFAQQNIGKKCIYLDLNNDLV